RRSKGDRREEARERRSVADKLSLLYFFLRFAVLIARARAFSCLAQAQKKQSQSKKPLGKKCPIPSPKSDLLSHLRLLPRLLREAPLFLGSLKPPRRRALLLAFATII
ncbi:hypothetical protein EBZ37_13985, partial [bacterium]|nr:hypothetical protein [bacterium]